MKRAAGRSHDDFGTRRPEPGATHHFTKSLIRLAAALTMLVSGALVAAGCGSDSPDASKKATATPKAKPASLGTEAPGLIAFRRFVDSANERAAIFTIRPDGTGERQITDPSDASDSPSSISPDGKLLAYEHCPLEGDCEVWISNIDGSDARHLDVPCERKPICDLAGPMWSPDGKTLLMQRASGRVKQDQIERSEIGTVDDVARPKFRTLARLDRWQGDLSHAVFSPDGRKIAYERQTGWSVANDRWREQAVYVMPAGGGKGRRITPLQLYAGDSPDWSPDGEWILFRTNPEREDQISDIGIVHPDGGGLLLLTSHTEPGQVLSSSFSPDGEWIVHAAAGTEGEPDLFVMRPDGTDARPLTRTAQWDSSPEWGPEAQPDQAPPGGTGGGGEE